MLLKRIIPCLDVDQGRVVKGVQYVDHVDAGDPVEVAKRYDAQEADEITFLDISASHEERGILLDVVSRTAESVFMPLTVGGGRAHARGHSRPPERWCGQSLDHDCGDQESRSRDRRVRENWKCKPRPSRSTRSACRPRTRPDRWEVFTHGGRQSTGIDAVEWAARMAEAGAGEILLTSMDRDGTKSGYDLAMLRAVTDRISIPVIASGGGGSAADLASALQEGPDGGHCQAALAASIFHFKETTVGEVKRELLAAGVPVRPPHEAA